MFWKIFSKIFQEVHQIRIFGNKVLISKSSFLFTDSSILLDPIITLIDNNYYFKMNILSNLSEDNSKFSFVLSQLKVSCAVWSSQFSNVWEALVVHSHL